MTGSSLIILSMLVPLAACILISRLKSVPNVRELVSIVAALTLVVVNLGVFSLSDQQTSAAPWELAQPAQGLSIAFSVNDLGVLFALVASPLWLVTTVYAIGYMRHHNEPRQTKFFALFALAIFAVMGIAYADNLFTLFLFYEVLTLSTYPLVTHHGSSKARKAGRVYLMILMGSSIALLLPAILVVWFVSGDLQFKPGGTLAGHIDPAWVMPLMLLFLFGIAKAALMPMHRWLPAAMVAPTPVSALLHAVAVVKAGVFAVFKVVVFIFGTDLLHSSGVLHTLVWLPMITIVLASAIALTRDNIKERLAYSTISQLSYIILGVLLANTHGLIGGTLHIVMHASAKITLFFAAGAIIITSHKTRVSEIRGLGRQMPFTFAFFTVAALSIIGFPLLGGMWSKWYLLLGSLEFNGADLTVYALLLTLLLSSLLNIAYLLQVPAVAFFSAKGPAVERKEAPVPCIAAMAVTTALCLWLFWQPRPFLQLAERLAGGLG